MVEIYAIIAYTDLSEYRHGIEITARSGETEEKAALSLYYDAKVNGVEVLFDSVYGWNDAAFDRLNSTDFAQINIKRNFAADLFDAISISMQNDYNNPFMSGDIGLYYDNESKASKLADEILSASEFETTKVIDNQFNTINTQLEDNLASVRTQLDNQNDNINILQANLNNYLYKSNFYSGRGYLSLVGVNNRVSFRSNSNLNAYRYGSFMRVIEPLVLGVTLDTLVNETLCSWQAYSCTPWGDRQAASMEILSALTTINGITTADCYLKYLGQSEIIAIDLYTGEQIPVCIRPSYSLSYSGTKYYDGDSPHRIATYTQSGSYARYDLWLDLSRFELRDDNPRKLLLDIPLANTTLGCMQIELRPVVGPGTGE